MKKINTPQKKGIILKLYILKPKKPNSALRKICKIKLKKINIVINCFIKYHTKYIIEYNIILIINKKKNDLIGIFFSTL